MTRVLMVVAWGGVVAAVAWWATRYDQDAEGWDEFRVWSDEELGLKQWRNHPSQVGWVPRCLN